MSRKIFKTGHSLAVTLSRKILGQMGLSEGSKVTVELDAGKNQVIIRLDQKHAQLTLDLPRTREVLGRIRKTK